MFRSVFTKNLEIRFSFCNNEKHREEEGAEDEPWREDAVDDEIT